jgi:hypothetical protein
MIDFISRKDCGYKYDYEAIFVDIANGILPPIPTYRSLILNDLFFIVLFVMRIPGANHPFVVDACREVEYGPKSNTLDVWAREHFKSTIITIAETVQEILANPEERVAIFSHTRPIAKGFLRSIKLLFEESELLKECFPDVLYKSPQSEASKWSEDDGLVVKRKGYYKESTVEAWGLVEGMPTSKHFTRRVYDDIETDDLVENPDMIIKVKRKFNLSQNLGTASGTKRVVGTYYHHEATLAHVRDKKDANGEDVYITRRKPATEDGTATGKPILLGQKKIDELRIDEHEFNCQQLLDPTPVGIRRLSGDMLTDIAPKDIPYRLYKFMLIDPAGDDKDGKGDAWAVWTVGVEPYRDEIGASNVYILDGVVTPMRETEAIDQITRMYLKAGVVMQLGVEKVGLSTTEIHIAKALGARGRHLSIDAGNLILLRPSGRKKARRIESALAWPLYNSKIHISTLVPEVTRERLRLEMDKFPYWHDDGLDALSYLYDIIKEYRFGVYMEEDEYEKNVLSEPANNELSWMTA